MTFLEKQLERVQSVEDTNDFTNGIELFFKLAVEEGWTEAEAVEHFTDTDEKNEFRKGLEFAYDLVKSHLKEENNYGSY